MGGRTMEMISFMKMQTNSGEHERLDELMHLKCDMERREAKSKAEATHTRKIMIGPYHNIGVLNTKTCIA